MFPNPPSSLLRAILLTALPFASIACVTDADLGTDPDKEDRWNDSNSPENIVDVYSFNWEVLNISALQKQAVSPAPWPDTYWPMMSDGFNDRWQGERTALSPMEAYDRAFNDWVPSMGFDAFFDLDKFALPGLPYDEDYYDELGPAATWAHEEGGNYAARSVTDPDGTPDWGSDDPWGGLEGWFGHCNAWAPAAMSLAEPQHAVVMNGVTFEVADIKALLQATFDGVDEKFLGGRCHDEFVARDKFGRIISERCRDTNPGAFYVATVNRLGLLKQSFVMDVTLDQAVWNQPVLGYDISLQEEVGLVDALALIGRSDATSYPYNGDARRFVHVQMEMDYIVEGAASATPYLSQIGRFTSSHDYDFLLELEADGTIIGGEWIDDNPHPDFIWAPEEASDVTDGFWGSVVIDKDIIDELHRRSL